MYPPCCSRPGGEDELPWSGQTVELHVFDFLVVKGLREPLTSSRTSINTKVGGRASLPSASVGRGRRRGRPTNDGDACRWNS